MISAELTYDIRMLSESCRQYGILSGKTEGEVIDKQSDKLGRNIYKGLKALAPARGFVRAERLAALAGGEGVHVRPGVYEELRIKLGPEFESKRQRFKGPNNELAGTSFNARRTMNFQALAVQRELALRESGRGFMAWSTPRNRSSAELAHIVRESKYGYVLSMFNIDVRPDAEHKFASFVWDSNSKALEGLNEAQQMDVLEKAVVETTADVMQYVDRKLTEDASRAELL